MIDFDLGDELELLRSTAQQFAADHLRPALRDHESARQISQPAHAAFAEIGFAALECPESLGGSALGSLARCLMMEELAAADPGAALALDRLGAALYPIAEMGGDEALERFARPVLDTPDTRAALVWCGEGARALGARLVARTGAPASGLARAAEIALDCGVAEEGGPLGLAPRASVLAQILAVAALAGALQDRKQLSREAYHQRHPAGALGRRSDSGD